MGKIKQNLSLILITFATVVLAVIAVTTALKLQQIGKEPIAPTAPQPAPAREPVSACRLTFTIGGPSVTPTTTPAISPTPTTTPRISLTPTTTPRVTSTPGPTLTPGPTATPGPRTGCYRECGVNGDCENQLRCQTISGSKKCVNPDCPEEGDCACNKACWRSCGNDNECPGGLVCHQIGADKKCVNPTCETEQDCDCTPPPTPTEPQLPKAGISLPTVGALIGGAVLVITSLLLIL